MWLGQQATECILRSVLRRNVHYSEICKPELRGSDRRAAMCVENMFFKAKENTYSWRLKKTTEGLQSLINRNDSFRFLKTLKGSPPYFEKAKRTCLLRFDN